MATAKMHFQSPRRRRGAALNQEAALLMLRLERFAEVLQVLVGEIVALGYPRAAVLEVRHDSDAVVAAAVNWLASDVAQVVEGLRGPIGPLESALLGNRTEIIEDPAHGGFLSLHPMLYASANPCREAANAHAGNCLAVQNVNDATRPPLQDQLCSVCGIRGYTLVAVIDLGRNRAGADSTALSNLIGLGNEHLTRLAQVDHYRKRISELEAALASKDARDTARLEEELLTRAQRQSMVQNKEQVERRMMEIEKFASAGRLAATIAHEVNNPMEAIKNAVYLLAGVIPESSLPVYNILKSETERVARVVRQMLGLYRDTEPAKPVSVNTILEDTLLLLNRQLQRANIQVEAQLGVLPEAFVAADQMRQVFSNLIINARDAMPTGGKLVIRSRHMTGRDPASSAIRVLVADSGSGIPREIIGDIFEPFVTTKGGGGTGLGLWIVKGIIRNHGGKITVRSRVGQGTVFRIDLPVAKP